MRSLQPTLLATVLFLSGIVSVQAATLQTTTATPVHTTTMAACTIAQCGEKPMIKTGYCSDGSVAARAVCERQATGKCGYTIRSMCAIASSVTSLPTERKPNCAATIRCMEGTRPICRTGKPRCVPNLPTPVSSSQSINVSCASTILCAPGTKPTCSARGNPSCVKI